jgi:carboxyl-terminal processing protease
MNKTGRNIIVVFLALFLLAGSFSGGLLCGWLIPSKTTLESSLSANLSATATATQPSSATQNTTELFAPFWEAWQIVHEQYVDQPVDDTKLMQGAIRGMMDSLGDKHTSYMDPDEYAAAMAPLSGEEYEGIGAYVDATGQYLTIVSPMIGSPAEAAGLRPGDEIIGVDGKDVTGIDPNTVLKSVKGTAGTQVILTIYRPKTDKTFDVEVTRAKLAPDKVSGKILDDGIAYVIIPTFGDNTSAELKTTLTDLLAKDPKGLIVDLRNNGGGYLKTAIEVVSQFIGSGVVLYEQEGDGTMNTYNAISGGVATKIPLVVLVNDGTASAAEITAGAIQDYNRGKLVGITTYGKGSVQNWIELNNSQGAVRVTIARWLTPNKRQINEVGLTPDYVVEESDSQYSSDVPDPQLQKAEELLLSTN